MSSPTMKRNIISCQTLVMTFGLLLSALLFATPHHAQSFQVGLGLHREGTNDPKGPVFRVRAMKDNKIYDTLEGTYQEIPYKIKAKGRCPDNYHLLNGSWITLANGNGKRDLSFSVNENNRSLGGNQGQDWNHSSFDFPFLLPKFSPVETCNAEVKRRQNAGQSLGAILQNGFSVFVDNAYDVSLHIWCEKNGLVGFHKKWDYLASATLPATVECRATGYVPPDPNAPQPRTETKTKHGGRPGKPLSSRAPAPDPPRLPSPPPPLASVSVAANPTETTGRGCPLYVNFKGKIEPNPDSNYTTFNTKYRFVGDKGYQTDWTFVAVSRSEPRTVNGRRFIQAPANNPGGTLLAPGEKPRIPLYLGWMELEVQLPNGSKRSERANFTVDCNVAPEKQAVAPRVWDPKKKIEVAGSSETNGGTGRDQISSFGSGNNSTAGKPTNQGPRAAQPDLVIKQFLFPPTNDKALRVQVSNDGSAASGAARLIIVVRKINGSAVGRQTHVNIPALAPGNNVWLVIDARSILPNNVALQSTTFSLNADGTEIVVESDETNNEVWHHL